MSDGFVVASWGLYWLMASMSPVSATTVVWRFRDSSRFIGHLGRAHRKARAALFSGSNETLLVSVSGIPLASIGSVLACSLRQTQLLLGRLDNPIGSKAELRLQFLERGGCAERVHADHMPRAADVAFPTEHRGLLDRHTGFHPCRQHFLPILGVLATMVLEHFPGWHAHDAGLHSLGAQSFVRCQAKRNLASGREQQHVGPPIGGVCEHVRAARDTLGRG